MRYASPANLKTLLALGCAAALSLLISACSTFGPARYYNNHAAVDADPGCADSLHNPHDPAPSRCTRQMGVEWTTGGADTPVDLHRHDHP
jgi:hypothetical protein